VRTATRTTVSAWPAKPQPEASFGGQYLHADIFEMAAAYLYHLVMNHPFVDGNKRVGLEAALIFLEINNENLNCSDEELIDLVLKTTAGSGRETGNRRVLPIPLRAMKMRIDGAVRDDRQEHEHENPLRWPRLFHSMGTRTHRARHPTATQPRPLPGSVAGTDHRTAPL